MQRAQAQSPLIRQGFGHTTRSDAWWVQPSVVFLGLAAFVVYATWAAAQGAHYRFGPYLSPFYSPELFGDSGHALLGPWPAWWPSWLPASPAFLILWAPAGFRLTCYYYRGAYYKAFWADPPSCTVGEPRKSYRGERSFPLILQNVHRYFLYIALIFLPILAWDAVLGMRFEDGATGQASFGIGVGTLVLVMNVVLLAGYTLGCHSARHLIGGKLTQISKHRARYPAYVCLTHFNKRHMYWAWASLIWVASTDLYIRLCSMGIITDWRIL